jgi:hypothetical protein
VRGAKAFVAVWPRLFVAPFKLRAILWLLPSLLLLNACFRLEVSSVDYEAACRGRTPLIELHGQIYRHHFARDMSDPDAQQSRVASAIATIDHGYNWGRHLRASSVMSYVDDDCIAQQAQAGDPLALFVLYIYRRLPDGTFTMRENGAASPQDMQTLLFLSQGALRACPVMPSGLSLCNDLLRRGQLSCPCGLPEAQMTLANHLCSSGHTEDGVIWYRRAVSGGAPRTRGDSCFLHDQEFFDERGGE